MYAIYACDRGRWTELIRGPRFALLKGWVLSGGDASIVTQSLDTRSETRPTPLVASIETQYLPSWPRGSDRAAWSSVLLASRPMSPVRGTKSQVRAALPTQYEYVAMSLSPSTKPSQRTANTAVGLPIPGRDPRTCEEGRTGRWEGGREGEAASSELMGLILGSFPSIGTASS